MTASVPDSNAPSSLEAPMKMFSTAETRPRIASGVRSWTSVVRITTLTSSFAFGPVVGFRLTITSVPMRKRTLHRFPCGEIREKVAIEEESPQSRALLGMTPFDVAQGDTAAATPFARMPVPASDST